MKALLVKFASRKFLTAVACYSIVLLAGLGVAEFDAGIVAAANAGLIAYIGVQGVVDGLAARNGK